MKKSIKHGDYVDDMAFYKTLKCGPSRMKDVDELYWLVHIVLITGTCNEYMYQRFCEILRG